MAHREPLRRTRRRSEPARPLDIAGLEAAGQTRRGVVPNAGAAAFVRAMMELEPLLVAELARLEQARRVASDRHLVDDLRRAMRGLRERLPHYDLPDVEGGCEAGSHTAPRPPVEASPGVDEAKTVEAQPGLFAAGPLAAVSIAPRNIAVRPGEERRVRALPVDREGQAVREGVRFEWSVDRPGFAIQGDGARPAVAAGDRPVGSEARLCVVVRQRDCEVTAEAPVVVVAGDERRVRGGTGVPRPELVDAPGAVWRSRMRGGSWEVNAGHEDYVALGEGKPRVRYLVALLGKEIVARTYAQPGAAELLEHLVAVIAHAERNLRMGGERETRG